MATRIDEVSLKVLFLWIETAVRNQFAARAVQVRVTSNGPSGERGVEIVVPGAVRSAWVEPRDFELDGGGRIVSATLLAFSLEEGPLPARPISKHAGGTGLRWVQGRGTTEGHFEEWDPEAADPGGPNLSGALDRIFRDLAR